MAGHSKWANIQHRKKAQDAKRGKLFTKLIREITVAARMGGAEPDGNSRLRLAMDKALAANMGKDTIDRAIKRGSGETDGQAFENVRYEGYGPGGVAILIECTTDNRNRTVAEIRFVFNKHGGNLGEAGSVAYLFKQTGTLFYEDEQTEDRFLEAALEAGADDIININATTQVLTEPEQLLSVKQALSDSGFAPQAFGMEMRPDAYTPVSDDDAEKLSRLIAALEDLDDVQDVYCNADFPESGDSS